MFKHILIPIDGSPRGRKALKAGIAFAKEVGAKVTAYHALEIIPAYYGEGFIPPAALEPVEAAARKQAKKYLDEAARIAAAAGVPCESRVSQPAAVYEGIIEAARKNKCDAIFMASHGRGELASLVLGSVTIKVLAHSKVPVVVFR
ncbi:MAG TPA: universal stress protein [Casimicrobiaceae bacterium]|nr:universal stress protein [Casimicrobiaceae bacterium]